MTPKRLYLAVLLQQDLSWIVGSLANPTKGMTPMHLALHRLALRKLGHPAAQKAVRVPFVDVSYETAYGVTSRFSSPVRVY